jgi:hypothetical protein
MKHGKRSRRQLLQMGAAVGGSLLTGQGALALDTDPRKLGEPLGPYGERSPFEKAVRWRRESKTPETGSSFTPLHDSVGIVTPSALHYERHHSGIPTIDPAGGGRHVLWNPKGAGREPAPDQQLAALSRRDSSLDCHSVGGTARGRRRRSPAGRHDGDARQSELERMGRGLQATHDLSMELERPAAAWQFHGCDRRLRRLIIQLSPPLV